MSAGLLFKRFLSSPLKVAYLVPSSPALTKRVSRKIQFENARVIVEFGPGEGCHTREIVKRMRADAHLLLFEIDAELAKHLQEQFASDPRVSVVHGDAQSLPVELQKRGFDACDYVVSGIPFSYLEINKKRALLQEIHRSLSNERHAAFIVYQVTTELKQHTKHFARTETEYCLQNFPPMFITTFYKQGVSRQNGSAEAARKHTKRIKK